MKKKIKTELLKQLKGMMRDEHYGPMHKGLKKVTVMSDSEKGLERGLGKAEEILKKRMDMLGMEEKDSEESEEESDEECFEEMDEEAKEMMDEDSEEMSEESEPSDFIKKALKKKLRKG